MAANSRSTRLTFVMGSDPISGEHLLLVEQPFHLEPLLEGKLDAAQALTLQLATAAFSAKPIQRPASFSGKPT